MSKRRSRASYESALDLPSVVELLDQIKGMKTLTRFVGRAHRREVLETDQGLPALAQEIVRFYELLGARNGISHDSLLAERARALPALPADDAEVGLITLYRDPEWLRFMIGK